MTVDRVLFDEEKFGCIQKGPDQIREVVFGRTGLVEQKFLFGLRGQPVEDAEKNNLGLFAGIGNGADFSEKKGIRTR